MDIHGPGGKTDEETNDLKTRHCGQICGSICLIHRNAKKSNNGPSRNPNSKMPEGYVLFSLLNMMMKNSSV